MKNAKKNPLMLAFCKNALFALKFAVENLMSVLIEYFFHNTSVPT
jgi:hypothetical protein